jgi:hypothetical protein
MANPGRHRRKTMDSHELDMLRREFENYVRNLMSEINDLNSSLRNQVDGLWQEAINDLKTKIREER